MSCSLAQKLSPETSQKKRIILGFGITDEIFAISSSRKGSLNPFYSYGAMAVSILPWALGSAFGVVLGNILPVRIVSALSVALYGMFLAIIIPPSRKDRTGTGHCHCRFHNKLAVRNTSRYIFSWQRHPYHYPDSSDIRRGGNHQTCTGKN
jgi:predicted branched-subunit amino acid permease